MSDKISNANSEMLLRPLFRNSIQMVSFTLTFLRSPKVIIRFFSSSSSSFSSSSSSSSASTTYASTASSSPSASASITTTAFFVFCLLLVHNLGPPGVQASWEQWWTYSGISGPDFWGRLNPKWSLCSRGRRQSPIDINPELLLFDPILPPLDIVGHHVRGNLINTGRGIIFKVSGSSSSTTSLLDDGSPPSDPPPPLVLLINGPLSYRYTLSHLSLHYGRDITRGSEHTINGAQFSGEIQLYGYNSQLYNSWEEASNRAHGVVAVAVLIQTSSDSKLVNNQLKRVTHALKNITAKGSSQRINSLSVEELLPKVSRQQYITYEGSLTEPACYETVTWVILNKPIYMTAHLFHLLRMSIHDETNHGADTFRPIQKVNGRSIRTNINFVSPATSYGSGQQSGVNNGGSTQQHSLGNSREQDKGNEIDHGTSRKKAGLESSYPNEKHCTMKRPVVYKANTRNFQDI